MSQKLCSQEPKGDFFNRLEDRTKKQVEGRRRMMIRAAKKQGEVNSVVVWDNADDISGQ